MICRHWKRTNTPERFPEHSPRTGSAAAATILGVVLAACAILCTSGAAASELSDAALGLVAQKLQLAYATGLDAYETLLRQTPPVETPPAPADRTGDPVLQKLVGEASNRFGVPERWIRAVMRVESEGIAISRKGAMGLMQVMPDTYAGLRDRYGLGDDPYATRDNIHAGAAYIREMYDRFGSPGFIAAYNAGPARYDDYLSRGRDLPDETLRYVAAVGEALGQSFAGTVFGHLPPPRSAPLRFREPLAVSADGGLTLGRTGQPITTSDRLALHSLLSRAVGVR
jgi:soluble lytic murein transglycosylase-like protein